MNEQIKQLAGRVAPVAIIGNWGRVECMDNVYPQLGDTMYAAIDLQKFAESIIKECANAAVQKDAGMAYTADVAGHVAAGRSIAARMIKEQFGVEE